MATLADLFVSYKSVQPTTSFKTPDENPFANILAARSRLQQLIETIDRPQPDNPEQSDTEQLEAPNEQTSSGYKFSWSMQPVDTPFAAQEESAEPMSYQGYTPLGPSVKYNRGRLSEEIKELFDKHGINVTVTSGKRAAGVAGKAGSRSYHVDGNAVDIVPGKGETFESIRRKMSSNPDILQFMYKNGLGVIDETNEATMKRTGATGKHFHIGPDRLALQTWAQWSNNHTTPQDTKQEWAKNTHAAFVKGLRDEFGPQYNSNDYNRIATYMTYQAALESGYGQKANGYNYSGHMRNGKTIHYNTMNEFVKAHVKTLKKWDFMKADSLKEYVDSLYQGNLKYNAHDSADTYYNAINGTSSRVNRYLGLYAKFGGKFETIRQLHEQSFS